MANANHSNKKYSTHIHACTYVDICILVTMQLTICENLMHAQNTFQTIACQIFKHTKTIADMWCVTAQTNKLNAHDPLTQITFCCHIFLYGHAIQSACCAKQYTIWTMHKYISIYIYIYAWSYDPQNKKSRGHSLNKVLTQWRQSLYYDVDQI